MQKLLKEIIENHEIVNIATTGLDSGTLNVLYYYGDDDHKVDRIDIEMDDWTAIAEAMHDFNNESDSLDSIQLIDAMFDWIHAAATDADIKQILVKYAAMRMPVSEVENPRAVAETLSKTIYLIPSTPRIEKIVHSLDQFDHAYNYSISDQDDWGPRHRQYKLLFDALANCSVSQRERIARKVKPATRYYLPLCFGAFYKDAFIETLSTLQIA